MMIVFLLNVQEQATQKGTSPVHSEQYMCWKKVSSYSLPGRQAISTLPIDFQQQSPHTKGTMRSNTSRRRADWDVWPTVFMSLESDYSPSNIATTLLGSDCKRLTANRVDLLFNLVWLAQNRPMFKVVRVRLCLLATGVIVYLDRLDSNFQQVLPSNYFPCLDKHLWDDWSFISFKNTPEPR